MYDYFDKHGKKLLAVVGSLLVLVFLLPAGFGSGAGGNGARLGKLDGTRISVNDVQGAQSSMRALDQLVFPDRRSGQLVPIAKAIFPNGLDTQLQQNPVLLYLLMHEADKAGASIPDNELERYLRSPVQLVVDGKPEDLDRVNPAVKDALRNDLRRTLSIVGYFIRMQTAIKISRPLIDDAVAREAQQIKARVAAFKAADYDKQVAAPAEDDLARQFKAYADVTPMVTPDNPFGFGYRVPDRVAVQWLSVPDAEVVKSVEASKSAELWDEDAIIYYQQHPSEFASTPPSSTQPTTRPFAQVRAEVLQKLRSPLIEQQRRAVANRIVQQLSVLHTEAAKQPSTAAADSFDSLKAVADSVQKQTGVRPVAVAPAGMLSLDDLEKQPGFGKTTGPSVLLDTLRPLVSKDTAASVIDLGQPTQVLAGPDGLYVARAVAGEPAHAAPSIDAVKTQVEADVRRSRAFDLAATAAQAALDKAKAAGGLDKTGVAFQTSDYFSSDTPAPAGIKGDFAAGIVGPALETLRGLTSISELPARTIAKLRKDGVAAVVEVIDVRTTLNTAIATQARAGAEQQVAASTVPPGIVDQWFNFDAVSRRVGYVPDAPRPEDLPKSPGGPAAPASPFLPG